MASPIGRVLSSAPPPPLTARFLLTVRYATTESARPPSNRPHHSPPAPHHEYAKPCEFLGSWKTPPPTSDPRDAEKKLALLRREYAKQVKERRREYAYEMELQRQEKLRKDEARREAARLAKEERKAAKAAAAKVAAAERKAFEDEFRQTLLKERAEKMKSWRAKEELREKKKTEKNELLRRQSSMWIGENELEKRILDVVVDTTPL